MKRALTGIVVLAFLASGCNAPMPGFRFAPSEEQKQTAQVSTDLASVANQAGLPPGSTAAHRMSGAARATATYTGYPTEPINIEDLVPAAVTNAWGNLEKSAEAWRLKREIRAKTSEVVAARLAELAEAIKDKATVSAAELIYLVRSVVETHKMGLEIAEAIPIPDEQMTDAERALMTAAAKLTKQATAAAQAQASRRPTVSEVVDKSLDQADSTIDKIGGILESYGLLALIPGAGGVVYAARKRKQQKQAIAERDTAQADAKIALNDAQRMERESVIARQAAADQALRAAELMGVPPAGGITAGNKE